MLISMVGWIALGLVGGLVARESFPDAYRVDPASLLLLGAIGAWFGGLAAYLCRFNLEPSNPGHWIMATAGAGTLLTLRFLGTKREVAY